ncbi:MAG: prepilin-type N-terminal cleavage/methylation domain-containing protein [bacterium]
MKNLRYNLLGFSFIEFVIVIVILSILSVLTSSSVHHLRASNRNAKRVADIMEVQAALEMYYRGEGEYPDEIVMGGTLEKDGVVYMHKVPSNPEPRDDGDCLGEQYEYLSAADYTSYTITFCISSRSGDVGPGNNTAIPGEIISCIPNCVKSCGDGSDGCGEFCDNADECPVIEECINDHCILPL